MSRVALLVGMLVVPVLLLWLGSRVRHASAAERGLFWGAVAGQVMSMVCGVWASLVPAITWGPEDRIRGVVALWGYVMLPAVGGLIGFLYGRAGRRSDHGNQ